MTTLAADRPYTVKVVIQARDETRRKFGGEHPKRQSPTDDKTGTLKF